MLSASMLSQGLALVGTASPDLLRAVAIPLLNHGLSLSSRPIRRGLVTKAGRSAGIAESAEPARWGTVPRADQPPRRPSTPHPHPHTPALCRPASVSAVAELHTSVSAPGTDANRAGQVDRCVSAWGRLVVMRTTVCVAPAGRCQ